MPTGHPPHKEFEQIASPQHRLSMLYEAVRGETGLYVSEMELKRRGITYSIDTLYQLQCMHPAEYFFIIGGDTLYDLPHWREIDKVCQLCQFIVFPRNGAVTEELKRTVFALEQVYGAKIHICAAPIPYISATDIRERLLCGQSVADVVPPSVDQYLRENDVYHAQ